MIGRALAGFEDLIRRRVRFHENYRLRVGDGTLIQISGFRKFNRTDEETEVDYSEQAGCKLTDIKGQIRNHGSWLSRGQQQHL